MMKYLTLLALCVMSLDLYGTYKINSEVKELLQGQITQNCGNDISWNASELSVKPEKILEISSSGSHLCFSGEKRVLARLDNAKMRVVKFSLEVYKKMLVFKNNVERGNVITKDDLDMKKIKLKTPRIRETLSKPDGYQARVTIKAGTPLYAHLTEKVQLVKRGEHVVISFKKNSISIVMDGIAKSNGGVDDTVAVMNLHTRKMLYGLVTEDGGVRIGGKNETKQ